ncbi:MAG: ATP-dependent DNA helicase RecG, partial [Candidatus Paceibacteria bacterium]
NLRHTAGLIPIYPETRGITSRALRFLIKPLISEATKLPDILPEELRSRLGILEFKTAIKEIHFPNSLKLAEASKKRFAFEELFLFQLLLFSQKRKMRRLPSLPIEPDIELVKKIIATLPFELTHDQKRAAWEIMKDMAKPSPMNRLLDGDVGSGKTIVAAISALQVLSKNYQVALMAPTEILSRQHFEKISKILEPFGAKIALLVSKEAKICEDGLSAKTNRQNLLEKLKNGDPYLVIGTHALIQKEVSFGNLALVIIDEQHRFGVKQRAHLTRGKTIPHLLSMTATPIPRTLALALYGDLDISLLKELPKGRKNIITKVIPPAKRNEAYDFIRAQVNKGRQAFIICPRIEAQNKTYEEYLLLDTRAVKEEYQRLSKEVFSELKLGMLHGKMKSYEKEKIMSDFAENKIQILVSTSVVEVGIDVPNATVMLIEGAENFGLAQLHQFRGRVGRGKHQSYCLLFTDSPAKAVKSRLEAFSQVNDGFVLAEEDLKIRGPGEIFGVRQS